MNEQLAKEITGGLSQTTKMPGPSYSIPAQECGVGSKMRKVLGSTCEKCYALKGRYVFGNVKLALYRRLASLTDERWVDAMIYLIKASSTNVFRFFDAGDLQSVEHLEKIVAVAKQCPEVKFWLPTREYISSIKNSKGIISAYVEKHGKKWPKNLTIRLSALMINGPAPSALAKRLGCVTSGVVTVENENTCPAPKNDNKCGTCRLCWSKEKIHVDYLKH